MIFQSDALEFRDQVRNLFSKRMIELAKLEAQQNDHEEVTADDFRNILSEAMSDVYKEITGDEIFN